MFVVVWACFVFGDRYHFHGAFNTIDVLNHMWGIENNDMTAAQVRCWTLTTLLWSICSIHVIITCRSKPCVLPGTRMLGKVEKMMQMNQVH